MKEKRKIIECSEAIAQAVRLCKPQVIAVYPITPQTHIVEHLASMLSNNNLHAEIIDVESEHSALSACIGAQAAGSRTFTASSSQGIALMSEMMFIASGMRLPIVMAVANRALSAPINIWNDHSDTMAQRDSGWMQFYCENTQEAYNTVIQAYKISENSKVMLPSIVCVDGFTLSHLLEPIELIEQKDVDSFLPKYKPLYKLDSEKPMTFGPIAYPNTYMHFKKQQQDAMLNALDVIKNSNKEFNQKFHRSYGDGLIETYFIDDAKKAFLCMGSICGTAREIIDKLRKKGKKVGLIKLKTFRPFPDKELQKLSKDLREISVIDRTISVGNSGPVFTEIKSALNGCNIKVKSFIAGLGGRNVAEKDLADALEKKGGWLL